MATDTRHPMYGYIPVLQRLKSRHSFTKCVEPLSMEPSKARCKLWSEEVSLPNLFVSPVENLPAGHKLPWPTWKSLNRLRTQVGRSKENMSRWGFSDATDLSCLCVANNGPPDYMSCVFEQLHAVGPDGCHRQCS